MNPQYLVEMVKPAVISQQEKIERMQEQVVQLKEK